MALNVLKEHITVKNIILFAIILVCLKFMAQISNILMLFFASYVIACSFNPLVNKMEKKIKRPIAVALLISAVMFTLFIFFIPVIVLSVQQIKLLFANLPAHIEGTKNFLLNLNLLGYNLASVIETSSLFESLSEFASKIVDHSITATVGIASALVNLFAFCLITYYFMLDEEHIKNSLIKLFPKKDGESVGEIAEAISKKIGGYVIAQVVTITSVGLIFTIALLCMRVEYAVVLGLITGILDLIPVIGPTIALVIALAVCWHYGLPIIIGIIVAYIFAQWAENNLIRPYVFSKFLDLHPLIIFFSILVTAKFLGIIGVIFAPAIAATICALVDEIYIKNLDKNEEIPAK